ncbi:MAG: hypothetical protein IPM46_14045 [Flavobacteriales bacterium]|nr:hypothetical protein [Flavobacteriales bacterium]
MKPTDHENLDGHLQQRFGSVRFIGLGPGELPLLAGTLSPYHSVTGGTAVQLWDEEGWHQTNGVPQHAVWLFGAAYDLSTLAIHRDGIARLRNDDATVFLHLAGTGLEPIDGTSGISYKLVETADGDMFVVQLRHMRLMNGVAVNHMNAQLWINLETGRLSMRFGPRSDENGSGFPGDSGPHVGIHQAMADGSDCMERVWPFGDPGNPQVAYDSNCEFPALFGLPESGVTFHFEPTFSVPTSINEPVQGRLSLRLNIVQDEVVVYSGDPHVRQARILDASGRIIRAIRVQPGDNTYETGDLVAGTYVLACDGGAVPLRFVKQ